MPDLKETSEEDIQKAKEEEDDEDEGTVEKICATTGVYNVTCEALDKHLEDTKEAATKAQKIITKIERISKKAG